MGRGQDTGVLIVDDEEDMRALLRSTIEIARCEALRKRLDDARSLAYSLAQSGLPGLLELLETDHLTGGVHCRYR